MLDIPQVSGAIESSEDGKRVYRLVLTGGKYEKNLRHCHLGINFILLRETIISNMIFTAVSFIT